MVKKTIFTLLFLLPVAGAAEGQTALRAPEVTPLIEKICLPLVRGGTVQAAVANAQPLAFTVSARNETMVTVERDETLSITVGPGSCYIGVTAAGFQHFRAIEAELRAWLPRL